jgi:hypothetical protein
MVPTGSAKVTVPPVPDDDDEDPDVPEHPAARSTRDAAIAVVHRLMTVQSLPIGRSQATVTYLTDGLTAKKLNELATETLSALANDLRQIVP